MRLGSKETFLLLKEKKGFLLSKLTETAGKIHFFTLNIFHSYFVTHSEDILTTEAIKADKK